MFNTNTKSTTRFYEIQQSTKFGQDAYNGPWTINKVCNNGTIKTTKGVVTNVYNIHNITLYQS